MMVKVIYENGSMYTCSTLVNLDLAVCHTRNVKSLEAGKFKYDKKRDGTALYHGLRVHKTMDNRVLWRVYILVTQWSKVFVGDQGLFTVLGDWHPGHQIYEKFEPTWYTKLCERGGPLYDDLLKNGSLPGPVMNAILGAGIDDYVMTLEAAAACLPMD